jgi:hypothetical protein
MFTAPPNPNVKLIEVFDEMIDEGPGSELSGLPVTKGYRRSIHLHEAAGKHWTRRL